MLLRTTLFWSTTQSEVVTTYRCFGKTYQSHLQGNSPEESNSHHLAVEACNSPHVVVFVCMLLLLMLILPKNLLFKH
jgi:hypothetical protein